MTRRKPQIVKEETFVTDGLLLNDEENPTEAWLSVITRRHYASGHKRDDYSVEHLVRESADQLDRAIVDFVAGKTLLDDDQGMLPVREAMERGRLLDKQLEA